MLSGLIYLIAFIFVLSVVVIVHEGGHFCVARLCGVKVTDFSLGFGKTLWQRVDKHGTHWRICALPLGGYVKMLGDEDAASAHSSDQSVPEAEQRYTFMAQPIYKRAAIIFAGPMMNYIFAILLLTGIIWTIGEVKIPPVVGEVVAASAAEKAGLQVGDVIARINGKTMTEYADVQRAVRLTEFGKPLEIEVVRDHQTLVLTALPQRNDADDMPKLGIVSGVGTVVVNKHLGLFPSLARASRDVMQMTVDTLIYLKQILFDRRSASDMRGPLGIAEASGDALKGGGLSLLIFIVQISVAIGFMNLLPIPVLDGGHLAMYAVEVIIRRPISDQFKNALLWGGVSLLFALMAWTFFLDVPRIAQRIFG